MPVLFSLPGTVVSCSSSHCRFYLFIVVIALTPVKVDFLNLWFKEQWNGYFLFCRACKVRFYKSIGFSLHFGHLRTFTSWLFPFLRARLEGPQRKRWGFSAVLWSLWGMWGVWTIIWKISLTWLNPRMSTVNDVLHGPLQHGSEITFTRTIWVARGNVKGLDHVWLKSGAIPNMLLWINVLVVWILTW